MKIKIITASIAAFVLVIIFTVIVFFYLNSAPGGFTSETGYTVQGGSTVRSNAQELKEYGLIKNTDFFVLLSYISGKKNMLTGTYTIYPGSNSLEILDKLSKGSVVTVQITIPEGYNVYSIASRFETAKICREDKFLFYAFDRTFLESLGIKAPSVEGYLYPDTYSFAPGSDPREIIRHLYKQMLHKLDEIDYKERMPEGLDLNKLLFLASIIEAEAQVKNEQRLISSVFHNRIRNNMRFDSDPTVRYAVKKFGGRLRYKDLDSPSPYNTYRKFGFPPGPIASPGIGAIEAALNPVISDYLYFVARNDGTHYFSRTLSRHNKAVDYYQKNINNGFVDEQL
ncbi:MAG: endolytic transglycosylase MltG [Spirochaetes bacterium]|nr:endolytic transglycosylase MltG [Spirochaetota bacterium]MBN2769178.1 endolytic transglycosylase MltG [Spirochaetota bacterium]